MRASLAGAAALLPFTLMSGTAHAAGGWTGGQDLLHVPLSWCAVAGSPAADNPNITPLGSATADTNTDAVLWRRHERPTDNIYTPQAGISFRSAINNSWGTLNFPIIADPDTSFGNPGDIRGEDLNVDDTEFNAVINACDNAWSALGIAGIGITAVNVNLFVDANGDYFDGASTATPIGWGGCLESVATGLCVAPYDGRIAVADNNYLYPTVADRTWPPSPNDPGGNFQYSITDSLDQLVGHELGHALGLAHRTGNTNALMFPQQQDNDGDGDTDNTVLNNAEVTQARDAALIVPGLEVDPPNQFDPGNFVRTRVPDKLDDVVVNDTVAPRYLDLAAVSVSVDTAGGLVYLDAQLGGVTPRRAEQVQVWYLVDTDGAQEGASPELLKELGVPDTRFAGADLVIAAEVFGTKVDGRGWRLVKGDPVALDERIVFDLARLIMHPYYPAGFKPPADREAGVYDVVRARLPRQLAGIGLEAPFTVQVLVGGRDLTFVDRLGDDDGAGERVVLEVPSFPHCYVPPDAIPGETAKIRIEGLRPNAPIHGLLGPREVFKGTTDIGGGGIVDLPVPADTRPGYHLVTIGNDDTALTADCTLLVVEKREREDDEPKVLDPQVYALLKSHEQLLHDQQRLLSLLAEMMQDAMDGGTLPGDEQAAMIRRFEELLAEQLKLIRRFETMINERVAP